MAGSEVRYGGVVIGEISARRFRLNVGDKLTLIVPEASKAAGGITPRMLRLSVVGVFKVGAELDGSLALIHIADASGIQRLADGQVVTGTAQAGGAVELAF